MTKLTKCDKCQDVITDIRYIHLDISIEVVISDNDREIAPMKSSFDYHDRCYQAIKKAFTE